MRRPVTLLIAVVVLAALAYGVSSYLGQRKFVETDNAYTAGDIINVGSQLDDVILWLGAEEGDYVEQGQDLVRLDGGMPKNRLARAQSDLAHTVQDVAALKQLVNRRVAEVREKEVRFTLARNEAERRTKLADRGMISKEERDISVLHMDEAKAALESSQQRLGEARINAGTMPIAEHPRVMTAGALARGMYAMVNKTRIVAPVAGHVAKRFVSAGDVIKAGKPLLQLVQLDKVWVQANFKETQLRNLRIGQPAKIRSDLYGEETVYTGTVVGTGTGTGAAFSLLPAQNATGNWIKIVQRVPVRIALDPETVKAHPLPLGTSLSVTVDTSDRSGARLTEAPSPRPMDVTATYGYWREGAREMVARIIAENLPSAEVRESTSRTAASQSD